MLHVTRKLGSVIVRGVGRETAVKSHAHQDTTVSAVKKNVQREVMATELVTT